MEHDDEALTAAGWTVRRFERRSGAQAGGRYQTWQPPAGGRAVRSRTGVARYLSAHAAAAAPAAAAPVPGALGAIAASPLLPPAARRARAVGKLRRACRALRAFDWAPVWAALVEARFPSPASATSRHLDDGPAFLAGGAAGTRWARGDVLTRSRRRFRVAFGAVLGAGRAYVGLAVARVFDDGAATLSSDDAILISSHGYISSATGGGAEGIPNRWGPGPDGWVDVRVDLDTHYISIATRLDRNGYIGLSEHSLRRRLRKGEALVPVVGVVAGSDAQLLPLVDTSAPGPPPWVPDVTGPFQDPHELPHVAFTL
ncbi:hypothetical protein JL720_2266 [Aureococcus anophagefferens]|nr:hypothetical protein JL720_2266 [Aureococcus anophagefferens]